MSVPLSGTIKLSNISSVFGGPTTSDIKFSYFYRNGVYIKNSASLSNIPTSTSTPIKFSYFYGKTKPILKTHILTSQSYKETSRHANMTPNMYIPTHITILDHLTVAFTGGDIGGDYISFRLFSGINYYNDSNNFLDINSTLTYYNVPIEPPSGNYIFFYLIGYRTVYAVTYPLVTVTLYYYE
jgi:hypothetical protein